MDLFLTLLERQMKLLDLVVDLWVPYLIGAIPSDVTSLIARRFNELKIDSFDGLKNLMIADQMKKKCSPECKEHYLDIWEELLSTEMLVDKLEAFDNIRRSLPSGPRRCVKAREIVNDGRQVSFRKPERPPKREYSHQNIETTNHINAYTAQNRSPRLTLIDITFCGTKGRVCADTGSLHSIAGERMFQIFKDKGLLFRETTLARSLADGQQITASHPLSNAGQGSSGKLMPRRDGPYVILTQMSPSSDEIASLYNPGVPVGVYHTSALTPCNNDKVKPLIPLRKRGRPPKVPQIPGSSSGCRRNQRGRMQQMAILYFSRALY
ncbi:uncharacterized protein TNCV_2898951 [Trichonephila clavipes]|nr:uncharacterized protein TNCV_2898951 [Trichonephila clavipes]